MWVWRSASFLGSRFREHREKVKPRPTPRPRRILCRYRWLGCLDERWTAAGDRQHGAGGFAPRLTAGSTSGYNSACTAYFLDSRSWSVTCGADHGRSILPH